MAIIKGMQGFQVAKEHVEKQKALDEQRAHKVYAYRSAPGATKRVLLLDTPMAFLTFHNARVNGRFEPIQCASPNRCAGCDSRQSSSFTLVATAIELTATQYNGTTYQFDRAILHFKKDAIPVIQKKIEQIKAKGVKEENALKFCVLELTRGSSTKSPTIGHIDIIERWPIDKVRNLFAKCIKPKLAKKASENTYGDRKQLTEAEYLSPANYDKVYPELPYDDMAALFGLSSAGGNDPYADGGFMDGGGFGSDFADNEFGGEFGGDAGAKAAGDDEFGAAASETDTSEFDTEGDDFGSSLDSGGNDDFGDLGGGVDETPPPFDNPDAGVVDDDLMGGSLDDVMAGIDKTTMLAKYMVDVHGCREAAVAKLNEQQMVTWLKGKGLSVDDVEAHYADAGSAPEDVQEDDPFEGVSDDALRKMVVKLSSMPAAVVAKFDRSKLIKLAS